MHIVMNKGNSPNVKIYAFHFLLMFFGGFFALWIIINQKFENNKYDILCLSNIFKNETKTATFRKVTHFHQHINRKSKSEAEMLISSLDIYKITTKIQILILLIL